MSDGREGSPSTGSGRTEGEMRGGGGDAAAGGGGGSPLSAPRPNRVIKLEHPGGGRRSVYVPLKRRSARFLEALAESGNVSLACDVSGLRKDRVYTLRKADADFARRWAEAKAAFEARCDAEEEMPDEEKLRADGLVLRTGRDGRVQVSKAHKRAWGARHDDIFFAAFCECGNISAAARATGFSYKAAWERARNSPAFAERLAAAKAEAVERLEWGLIEEGTMRMRGAAAGCGRGGAADARGRDARGAGGPVAVPDTELARWLVTRSDQERKGTLRRGPVAVAQPMSHGALVADMEKRLRAFQGRDEARRRAEGWTQTPSGDWVPPGYGPLAGGDG